MAAGRLVRRSSGLIRIFDVFDNSQRPKQDAAIEPRTPIFNEPDIFTASCHSCVAYAMTEPSSNALLVRNLTIIYGCPWKPRRRWQNITGLGLSIPIAISASRNRGLDIYKAISETKTLIVLFKARPIVPAGMTSAGEASR